MDIVLRDVTITVDVKANVTAVKDRAVVKINNLIL